MMTQNLARSKPGTQTPASNTPLEMASFTTLGRWYLMSLMLLTVIEFLVVVEAAFAMPIRTNTPGTGVFIGSGLLGQVIVEQESNSLGTFQDVTLISDFRYTPATHWVFGVRVPSILHRSFEDPLVGTESTSGLGDILLITKYRFFRSVGMWSDRHAAIEVDLKLPTGEADRRVDPQLPIQLQRRLQPGSGSTDVIFDLIYQAAKRRFVYAGDVSYRLNTEGDADYQFGNQVRLNLDLEYILLPRVYKKPGRELFLLLETTLVHKEADQFRSQELSETRRTELSLAPGLQYVATEQLLFSLSGQFPIFSDTEKEGLEKDYNILLEFRYAF